MRRSEAAAFYRHYLAAGNAHAFDRLSDFVAEDVRVNDEVQGLPAYVAGLREVVRAFPDYHWQLRGLLIDGDSIAAHFTDTGTHLGSSWAWRRPAGRSRRGSWRSTTSKAPDRRGVGDGGQPEPPRAAP